MRTGNSVRRELTKKEIPEAEDNKKGNNQKNKEKVYSSKRINSQVRYTPNSVRQNNNNIKRIQQNSKKIILKINEEDEKLDHPQPILSESEEELNEIKNLFIQKIENKKSLAMNSGKRKDKDLNLKYFKSTELTNYIDLLPEEKNQNIVNNKRNINLSVSKRDNKIICIKKNYKAGTSANKELNPFKSKLNNNVKKIINYNIIINNYNTDIKINENNEKFKEKNEPKQLFNYKNSRHINEQELFNNSKEKKDKNMKDSSYGKEYIYNNLNRSQQFRSKKHSNNNHSIYFDSTYFPIRKLKHKMEPMKRSLEEECEKNNSVDAFIQKIPTINNKEIKNVSNYKNIRNTNSIDLNRIKKNNPKVKIEPLYLKKKNNSNKSDIIQIPKIRKDSNISNHYLNISKVNSSEMKQPSYQERNSLLEKNEENQNTNYKKYSKNTFDKGRTYNNVQTTYVIISKKRISKGIPNPDIPEAKNKNNNNHIFLTQSANFINSSKLNNDINTQGNTVQINNQRNSLKERKESNNQVTIKQKYKKNYIFNNNNNNNNNGANLRKFVKSSINENNWKNFEKNKNTNHLINKSDNINKNISTIDYNNNYGYFYDEKKINKDSYVPIKSNYNY